MGSIKFAMEDPGGIAANSQHGWYNSFSTWVPGVQLSDAEEEDVQLYLHCTQSGSDYFHDCVPPCGRACKVKKGASPTVLPTEAASPTAVPTEAPKPTPLPSDASPGECDAASFSTVKKVKVKKAEEFTVP